MVLQSRGVVSDISIHVPSSQRNLIETGSNHLAGEAADVQEVTKAAQTLNTTGSTVSDILTLIQNTKSKNEGHKKHMATDDAAGNKLSPEELIKRYQSLNHFTSGKSFGLGDGEIGPSARDKVIRRNCLRNQREKAVVARKDQAIRKLIANVKRVRAKFKKPITKTTIERLKILCQYKKCPKDRPVPMLRDGLIKLFEATKGRTSPHVSLANSDGEDKGEIDDDGNGEENVADSAVDISSEEEDEASSDDKDGSDDEDGLEFSDCEEEDGEDAGYSGDD